MRIRNHRHAGLGISVLSLAVILCLLLSGCFVIPNTPQSTPDASDPASTTPEGAEHVDLPAAMVLPDETSIGKSKTFTGDGFTITLTDFFREQESEMGFDAYYTSSFGGVMVLKEPFSLDKELKDESLVEYTEGVIQNNGHDTHPLETDGLIYFRYTRDGLAGWSYSFKGSDAFYIFQFLCREEDAQSLSDLFFFFAKSVTVE